jgi:hypothetical protein
MTKESTTPSAGPKGNNLPSGQHYNLNVIGVPKEKAADIARQLQQTVSTAASSAASDASRAASSKYSADMQLRAEELRAKTAAASAAASRMDANERKVNDKYIAAGNGEARVLSDIAKERSSKEYLDLARTAALPESGSDMIKKQRSDAIVRLDAINKEHSKRASEAASRTKFYERQVMGDAAPTGAAADPLGLR